MSAAGDTLDKLTTFIDKLSASRPTVKFKIGIPPEEFAELTKEYTDKEVFIEGHHIVSYKLTHRRRAYVLLGYEN